MHIDATLGCAGATLRIESKRTKPPPVLVAPDVRCELSTTCMILDDMPIEAMRPHCDPGE